MHTNINKPYRFANFGKMMIILRWQWVLLILLLTIVQKAWTGKRTKALFSLRESKTSDGKQTDVLLNKDKELDSLLQQTKENLIKAFGLRENMISNGDKIQKREPHKYMKYIAQKYKDNYKNGIPLTANTVRGCVDIDHGDKRLADFPHVSFKFDVSEIPQSEILIQSELKVLMKPDSFGIRSIRNGFFRATVLGVVARNKAENKAKGRHVYPKLWEITSKTIAMVKGQTEHWVTFDITKFVNYIINVQRKHVKLVLRVKPLGGTSIDPKLMGLNNHIKLETEKGLLVIYSGEDEAPIVKKNKRSKRHVSNTYTEKSNKKNRKKNKKNKNKNNKNRRKGKRRRKACRRKDMEVDFDKFGWSNFLIEPSKQNIYYCHGHCRYPLPHYVPASNHATIQSIWHEMHSSVPPPCCVPDEFDMLPVLSLDGNDRVVFKMKEGLIVKSCACR
ncbi:growth/differentiation factor 6-A-like [Clytia hemisphaerica]|uniref:TGF-beta family profile domain-containing protein n=1 Tax=Clytia hemisphaerica TaxID=252671 RepID=A0A7M5TVN4_9CNID|eukprot:TCONS_00000118-protein